MVGVPGNGCHTCRRRRVKCDEQKPQCQRCQKCGKVCDGYERYATYVNRTEHGIQKRRRLEEAISTYQAIQLTKAFQDDFSHDTLSIQSSQNAPLPPLAKSHPDQFQLLLIRFLSIYQPLNSKDRTDCTLMWLNEAMPLYDSSPVLQTSLSALAENVVSNSSGDQALRNKSRVSYGEATRCLNATLNSPEAVQSDQTLAAIRCLMIYELFESTTESVQAWTSHQTGIVGMACERGPSGFNTSFSKALLADIKSVNMIQCLSYSIRSQFADPKWRTLLEPKNLNQIESAIFDAAFDFAAICEQDDRAARSEDQNGLYLKNRLSRIGEVTNRLDSLTATLEALRPTQLKDNAAYCWNLESALHLANIFVLSLDAFEAGSEMSRRLAQMSISPEQDLFPNPNLTYQNKHRAVELSRKIITAVKYATQDRMGLYGAQKSLFALRMLLSLSPPNSPIREESLALYDSIQCRKGLRHVESLNKEWGKPDNSSGARHG